MSQYMAFWLLPTVFSQIPHERFIFVTWENSSIGIALIRKAFAVNITIQEQTQVKLYIEH